MEKSIFGCLVPLMFSLSCISTNVEAQERLDRDSTDEQNAVLEKVEDLIEKEIKKNIRNKVTKELVEKFGSETLKKFASRIPGIKSKIGINPSMWFVQILLTPNELADATMSFEALAEIAIEGELSEACENGKGSVDGRGVHFLDFDGDTHIDMLLSHDAISCTGPMKQSLFCGAQVCLNKLFLQRADRLTVGGEFTGIIKNISSDFPPIISAYQHGGRAVQFQWDGQALAAQ